MPVMSYDQEIRAWAALEFGEATYMAPGAYPVTSVSSTQAVRGAPESPAGESKKNERGGN